ncbi:hypothetical protein ZWY2020_001240 [Hordeum vulgare]|nr:hypothetical protein ZWY2020_001240 [Hordeum vulgare]
MARKMLKDGEAPVASADDGGSYDYDLFVIGAGTLAHAPKGRSSASSQPMRRFVSRRHLAAAAALRRSPAAFAST